MEELRSTEILDREILEDARRKAERILASGEAECLQIINDVSSRLDRVRADKEAEYSKKNDAYRRDAESAIPLEKARHLVSFVDISVQESLDSWFKEIGPEKRLSLYAKQLERLKSVLNDARLNVWFIGYSETEIRLLVTNIFGKDSISSMAVLDVKNAAQAGCTDGLYIETTDSSIRCRASLEEVRERLLSEKRQELADVLFDGRLPE
jgi:V/A-type H+/Na+-transporting ATPase subunit E